MSYRKERKPFVTGSRVYGTPRKDSDLDVVVRADEYVIRIIESIVGRSASDYDHKSVSVQAGPINLHLCATDEEYDRWEKGTKSAEVVKPIDRETAKKLMRVHGIDRGTPSEPSTYSLRGPGRKPPVNDDGTVVPYRIWMGWDKLKGE